MSIPFKNIDYTVERRKLIHSAMSHLGTQRDIHGMFWGRECITELATTGHGDGGE